MSPHHQTEDELDESTFQRFEGSCHCGRFKFAITRQPFTKLHDCQCSICYMNGFRGLVWQPNHGKRKFEILRGSEEDDLISYNFARMIGTHKFCKECGTGVFARMNDAIGINAKTLSDADLIESIPTFMLEDGAHTKEPHYKTTRGEPVKWEGEPLKEGEVEYQGHCHCGNVRYAMHWKPMEEWMGNSCNCSFCWKRGGSHIYPPKAAIQFKYTPSDITSYSYMDTFSGENKASAIFCNICGTHVVVNVPKGQMWILNVRTVEGLSLKKLYELEERGNLKKFDGRHKDPQYQGGHHEEKEKGLKPQRETVVLQGTGQGSL